MFCNKVWFGVGTNTGIKNGKNICSPKIRENSSIDLFAHQEADLLRDAGRWLQVTLWAEEKLHLGEWE